MGAFLRVAVRMTATMIPMTIMRITHMMHLRDETCLSEKNSNRGYERSKSMSFLPGHWLLHHMGLWILRCSHLSVANPLTICPMTFLALSMSKEMFSRSSRMSSICFVCLLSSAAACTEHKGPAEMQVTSNQPTPIIPGPGRAPELLFQVCPARPSSSCSAIHLFPLCCGVPAR